jgi:hypothetical protein
MAQIRSPLRVRTNRPVPWRLPSAAPTCAPRSADSYALTNFATIASSAGGPGAGDGSRPAAGALRQELAGNIVVYASTRLVHTLMEYDLVDELRLMIYPVVLGAGERLFGQTSDKKPLRLTRAQTVGDGLALLTYERVTDA